MIKNHHGMFINKFQNYNLIKDKLINEIRVSPGRQLDDVTKTDWDGANYHHNSLYWNTIFPFIQESYNSIKLDSYKEYSNYVTVDWGYAWYQIYEKNSFHSYHTHPGCQYSNVFYVSLPNNKYRTEFFGIGKLNFEEGDLVTFPSYLLHRSPNNLEQNEKIVISFNTSFNCFTRFDKD